MRTQSTRSAGFTLVEIMIVVSIIGLLAAIAIPNFVRARSNAQANSCINNLRQIDGAKQQWALEFNRTGAATPAAADLAPFMGRGTGGSLINGPNPGDIHCPANGTYTIGQVQVLPACNIGVSVIPSHVMP
jgi:prepilin-type N-terminal cleavage/methylation domain-containing protein